MKIAQHLSAGESVVVFIDESDWGGRLNEALVTFGPSTRSAGLFSFAAIADCKIQLEYNFNLY